MMPGDLTPTVMMPAQVLDLLANGQASGSDP